MNSIAKSVEAIVVTAIKAPQLSDQCMTILSKDNLSIPEKLKQVFRVILVGLPTSVAKKLLNLASEEAETPQMNE